MSEIQELATELVALIEEDGDEPNKEYVNDACGHAINLYEDLDTEKVDVSELDLAEEFYDYMDFSIEPENARDSILRNVADAHGYDISEILESDSGSIPEVNVEDVDEDDQFYTLKVQVGELFDDHSDSMSQKGLLYDDTGRIVFKTWDVSEKPLLIEGQSYKLTAVASDEYQGNMSVTINSETQIDMIDEEFEPPSNEKEFTGSLVKIRPGSGLIKRCAVEDCNRVLDNGCSEHGDVDSEFDMRLKAVLDNGVETQDIIINRELTESITGINIEEAESIAKDALDSDVVTEKLEEKVLHRYYNVEGWVSDYDDIIVQDIDEAVLDENSVEDLVGRLNRLQTSSGQSELNEVN